MTKSLMIVVTIIGLLSVLYRGISEVWDAFSGFTIGIMFMYWLSVCLEGGKRNGNS